MLRGNHSYNLLVGTWWSEKRNARSWGLKFQIMRHPSCEPEMSCFMLGLKATLLTASLCPRNDLSSVGSSPILSVWLISAHFSVLRTPAARVGMLFAGILNSNMDV